MMTEQASESGKPSTSVAPRTKPEFERRGAGLLGWLLIMVGLWFLIALAGVWAYRGEFRSGKVLLAALPLTLFLTIWLIALGFRSHWKSPRGRE